MQSKVYSKSKLYRVGPFLNNFTVVPVDTLNINAISPENAIDIYTRFFKINNPAFVQAYDTEKEVLYCLNGECDGIITKEGKRVFLFDNVKYTEIKKRFETKI